MVLEELRVRFGPRSANSAPRPCGAGSWMHAAALGEEGVFFFKVAEATPAGSMQAGRARHYAGEEASIEVTREAI